ncbi:peptidoglycan editing factor PgeF [Melaminivora sp.]|uniref:peptidoglycan editing factor PgeF n=1 Tax=Melaminivora sp. TaxID=1933032 RepID=UPI0028AFFD3B|nr:peptidoglycan editing factor PgeF [Melaminivora sp.]
MSFRLPHDWITPDWPAPPQVRALCTTRSGGVSAAPRDSLNLGFGVGDPPGAVRANWAAVQATLGSTVRPVRLHQVHGTDVLEVGRLSPDGQPADGCTTTEAGVACVALAADCLPVLLTDRQGTRVAAVHAGWRGLAAGVLESALACFPAETRASQGDVAIKNEDAQADLLAWLGPCIGPGAFEVGPEVREAFCTPDPGAAAHFTPGREGRFQADLAALARRRLRAAGVTQLYGNDSSPPWCTLENPSRFFSHRRDSAILGATGRMAAAIWRVG